MMMDGTDADGEWSDEEVVRSGSNTGVSDTEQDDPLPTVTSNRPHSSLGIMSTRTTYSFMTPDPLSHCDDPVTSILDRIDAEIEMIHNPQIQTSCNSPQTPSLPSPPEKNSSNHRTGSSLKSKSKTKNTSFDVPSLVLHSADNLEDTDTGLGSVSGRGDEGSSPDKINGAADVYSEACMTDGQTDEDVLRRAADDVPSDLDSLAAQQIDTKFKEIMRKKEDDPIIESRHRPRRRKSQSEPRVHFLTPPPQFRDLSCSLPPDLPVHPRKPTASSSLTPRVRNHRNRSSATMLSTGYGTDNDSIRTEDFESKFQNLMVTSDTEKHQESTVVKREIPNSNRSERKRENTKEKPKSSSQTAEDDDILKRLINISHGKSPSSSHTPSASHAHSSSHTYQSPSSITTTRPRSLSPTRLSLRKHHTSGDLTGLWQPPPSSTNITKKTTDWRDYNLPTHQSRNSSSINSESTFDEVESLNLSRSSNDSSNRHYHDWGVSFGNKNNLNPGRGSDGLYIVHGAGHLDIGGEGSERGNGEGGWNHGLPGASDFHKKYYSRQSSTTSTSTSPSSLYFASSETSNGSSSRDMALTKKLAELLEVCNSQSDVGVKDRSHIREVLQHMVDTEAVQKLKSSQDQSKEKEERTVARYHDDDSFDHKFREVLFGHRSQNTSSQHYTKPVNTPKKRRKDLIIPDEDESSPSSYDIPNKNNKRDNQIFKHNNVSPEQIISKELGKKNIRSDSLTTAQSKRLRREKSHSDLFKNSNGKMWMSSNSLNKSGSFESNATPPDPFNAYGHPYSTSHAERVLMGLGFGGREGFLPERFLRDWYSKLSSPLAKDLQESDPKEKNKENQQMKSNKDSEERQTTHKKDKNAFYAAPRSVTQDSVASSQLDEAANLLPTDSGQDGKRRQITEYLSTLRPNDSSDGEMRAMRMMNFANSRQKSLPLHLETLSEEDEKSSRIPGVDPFDREAKLQMFITDVMSNSGKSTGSISENSILSSNLSECESVSSSSDAQNLTKLISAIPKHISEKSKDRQKNVTNNVMELSKSHRKEDLKNVSKEQCKSPSKYSPKGSGGRIRGAKLVRQNHKTSKDKSSPVEKEVHFSTDSLEVADIMKDQNSVVFPSKIDLHKDGVNSNKPMLKRCEPAMVSIVLEDVDEGKCGDGNTKGDLTRMDSGHLSIPLSRCSSMSLSPIPQSPVTVIEVGLDNQQDSLDTEDGNTSSKEIEERSGQEMRTSSSELCQSCGNPVAFTRKPLSEIDFMHLSNNNQIDNLPCRNVRGEHSQSSVSYEVGKNNLTVPNSNHTGIITSMSEENKYSDDGVQENSNNSFRIDRASPVLGDKKRPIDHVDMSPRQSPSFPVSSRQHIMHCGGKRDQSTNSYQQYISSPSSTPSVCDCNQIQRRIECFKHIEHQMPIPNNNQCSWQNQSCQLCFHHRHQNVHCCNHHRMEHHHHHHHLCPQSCESCLHSYRPYCHGVQETPFNVSICRHKYNPSINAYSSPGWLKSAFKSPIIERQPLVMDQEEMTDISETDHEEFPSQFTFNLDQRPISATSHNFDNQFSVSNSDMTCGVSESMRHVISPLKFSKETHLNTAKPSERTGTVQQISRAVQSDFPNKHDMKLTANVLKHTTHYLACDREVQCSLDIGDVSNKEVVLFNKSSQTRIQRYETSCQTTNERLLGSEDNNHHDHPHDLSAIKQTPKSHSKSINTVLCLIGDEHDDASYDALISITDNQNVQHHSSNFQYVDDTLNLIELELNAIHNKERVTKSSSHLPNSCNTDLSHTTICDTTTPSNTRPQLSRQNQLSILENKNTTRDVSGNPFMPQSSSQIPSSPSTLNFSNSNPFANWDEKDEKDHEKTGENKTIEMFHKHQVHNIFDLDKEMSLFLKPCKGMYDGMDHLQCFKSSPDNTSHMPIFAPKSVTNGEMHSFHSFSHVVNSLGTEHNDVEKGQSSFGTQLQGNQFPSFAHSTTDDSEIIKTEMSIQRCQTQFKDDEFKTNYVMEHEERNFDNGKMKELLFMPQQKTHVSKEKKLVGGIVKRKSTGSLCTPIMTFHRVPIYSPETIGKTYSPSCGEISEFSSKSAPTTTTIEMPVHDSLDRRKSKSLDDPKHYIGHVKLSDIVKDDKSKALPIMIIPLPKNDEHDVKSKSCLVRSPNLDITSDPSDMPRSSSRDSLTEVSVLSSAEEVTQIKSNPHFSAERNTKLNSQLPLQAKLCSESSPFTGLGIDSCWSLPTEIELPYPCLHSTWDGIYGKCPKTPTERFQRIQKTDSGKLPSVQSIDTLSDRSVAGSDKIQDIDDMEVMMSQSALERCDSDSSYSDLDDDVLDSLSQASSGLDRNNDQTGKGYLDVAGEGFDLLQVSDCGDVSPNLSPCHIISKTENTKHIDTLNSVKEKMSVENKARSDDMFETKKKNGYNCEMTEDKDEKNNYINEECHISMSKDEQKRKVREQFGLWVYGGDKDSSDGTQNLYDTTSTTARHFEISSIEHEDSTCSFDKSDTMRDRTSNDIKNDSTDEKLPDDLIQFKVSKPAGNRLLPTKSDPVDKTYTWWTKKITSRKNTESFEEQAGDPENISNDDCKNIESFEEQAGDPENISNDDCKNIESFEEQAGDPENISNDDCKNTESFEEQAGDPENISNDDCKKENLLMTFQKAEFISLFDNPASSGDSFFSLPHGDDLFDSLCHPSHKKPFGSEAHVLSIETDDRWDVNQISIKCPAQSLDMMDELEMISFLKNVESTGDLVHGDSETSTPFPYPLAEIPEEDTMSEESLQTENRQTSMLCGVKNVMGSVELLKTDKSVDISFHEAENDTDTNSQYTFLPTVCMAASDEHNKKNEKALIKQEQCIRQPEKTIMHSSCISIDSPSLISSHDTVTDCSTVISRESSQVRSSSEKSEPYNMKAESPILEKKIFSEERIQSPGFVFVCQVNSEISQRTVQNINSPKKSNPVKDFGVDTKHDGHLSTLNFAVGDYRVVESNTDQQTTDNRIMNVLKESSPKRQVVKTMFSQSEDEEYLPSFVTTKSYTIQNIPAKPIREKAKVQAGKSLRSRESLIRLHEQQNVYSSPGSDSDSDVTSAIKTHGDFDIRERDRTLGKLTGYTFDDDEENGDDDLTKWLRNDSSSSQQTVTKDKISISATNPQVLFSNKCISSFNPVNSQAETETKSKSNPRVIVQQASEDNPFWDMAWRDQTPSSNSSENDNVNSNNHNVHTKNTITPSSNHGQRDVFPSFENWSLPQKTQTDIWSRHTNRPNLLSPTVALFNNTFKDSTYSFSSDYSSTNDSHPELDYLDLIPKFGGTVKHESSADNKLSVPINTYGINAANKSHSVEKESYENENKDLKRGTKKRSENEKNYRKKSSENSTINGPIDMDSVVDTRSGEFVDKNDSINVNCDNIIGDCDQPKIDTRLSSTVNINDIGTTSQESDCQIVDLTDDNGLFENTDIVNIPNLKVATIPLESIISGHNSETSDSRVKSAASRDSWFESRGSSTDINSILKGTDRKITFSPLSDVEFESENLYL